MPEDFSKPTCKIVEESGGLFELPEVPDDDRETPGPAPSWRQQIAHAQMLITWRKAQRLPPDHPPRNPERFHL
ncbi:MAG: hypothetical protein HY360_24580 [Verrucomicrobia bacterium]|nr:hypothetical protein [Verrucomicrobiota bacterium]